MPSSAAYNPGGVVVPSLPPWYKCSAIGCIPSAIPAADRAHELAVAAFLASCDPVRVAALAAWPVLSERQMRRRLECEIPCGDERDLEIVGSRTRAGYAQPVH